MEGSLWLKNKANSMNNNTLIISIQLGFLKQNKFSFSKMERNGEVFKAETGRKVVSFMKRCFKRLDISFSTFAWKEMVEFPRFGFFFRTEWMRFWWSVGYSAQRRSQLPNSSDFNTFNGYNARNVSACSCQLRLLIKEEWECWDWSKVVQDVPSSSRLHCSRKPPSAPWASA